MIRLIQRRLIIPRGDTGSFSIPALKNSGDSIAVFTIFDETTKTKMFQKKIQVEGDVMNIAFTHSDTVNLKPGKYVWDIKYYTNPEFIDDELVNGTEVDSYYASFSLPVCEIRETADNYLVSPEAPDAKLSPGQLEIVTGAIHSLNEAIRKTQENVEHYPEIRDEVWYVWDAELGDYVSTNVRANGIVGNGIESAVLNDDYTLTLNFTDGSSFTSTSIRGQRGNGIEDIVLNNDFTLTITYTDGDSYVTPSIRGPVGATPQFSIGAVQDGAVAAASITGTAENPVLNLTLPNAHVPTRVSQLENDSNYAIDANYVHTDNNYTTVEKEKLSGIAAGAEVNVNADWNATSGDAQILNKPTKVSDFTNDAGYLSTETDPTVPAWAKEPNKPAYTAAEVGAPTIQQMNEAIANVNTMKIHICAQAEYDAETGVPTIQNPDTQTFYLVPGGEGNNLFIEWAYVNGAWERFGSADVEVPVQDVQVNGVSVLDAQGIANVPAAGESDGTVGVVAIRKGRGIGVRSDNHELYINYAGDATIKKGTDSQAPIVAGTQSLSTFYGLAKVAGHDEKDSTLPVGQYTDEAKAAIQTMLDVPAKADIPEVPVQDVQVSGVSVLDAQGVANIPAASNTTAGVVKVEASNGVAMLAVGTRAGHLVISPATSSHVKAGIHTAKPIVPNTQHEAAFYGLAKAAGSDEYNSTLPVGQYTDEAKGAIQSMLGITQMLAPENPNLVASQAYAIGDVFAANGHLYKATAAIAQDEAIIPDTNCVETTMVDAGGKIKDVQVDGNSVLENGVANIAAATASKAGVVIVNPTYGMYMTNRHIVIQPQSDLNIKNGRWEYGAITPSKQHMSAFYGLSKAAGVDLKDETVTLGTYPEASKTAIKEMLGVQDGLKVVRLI